MAIAGVEKRSTDIWNYSRYPLWHQSVVPWFEVHGINGSLGFCSALCLQQFFDELSKSLNVSHIGEFPSNQAGPCTLLPPLIHRIDTLPECLLV